MKKATFMVSVCVGALACPGSAFAKTATSRPPETPSVGAGGSLTEPGQARRIPDEGATGTPLPDASVPDPSQPASAQAAGSQVTQGEGGAKDIVVTGIRAGLQSAVETKRQAPAIVGSISAEDMGRFPDANLTESLQRITGVQITRNRGEGSQACVCDLDPNFN